MFLSAVSLSLGGYLLYVNAFVSLFLVETTLVAVVVLFVLSYFVARGNMYSINISTVLGVVAPIMSASTPAHVSVLRQLGSGGLISSLGALQLFGFYIFPITYVIIRFLFRTRLANLN